MCEWYENITDEQIEWLKGNRIQYRLLTAKEATLLNDVPLYECEWHNLGEWLPVRNQLCRHNDTVYRLRPDWERPKPEPEWVFRDIDLEFDGFGTPTLKGHRWTLFNVMQRAEYEGYVGTIYTWRQTRYIVDAWSRVTFLKGEHGGPEFNTWVTNPSVEPPRPVAVRVRERK